jgi:hypothetical protein
MKKRNKIHQTNLRSILALGSWLLALGSWLLAPGSWLLALGSWLLAPVILIHN